MNTILDRLPFWQVFVTCAAAVALYVLAVVAFWLARKPAPLPKPRRPVQPLITPELAELYRLEIETRRNEKRRASPKASTAARRTSGSGARANTLNLGVLPPSVQ